MLTEKIIAAGIEVHRHLGPGLLESIYETCLAKEFQLRRIHFEKQKVIPLTYKGEDTGENFRIDFFVQNEVIVEIKAADTISPIHTAQVLTYLKLLGCRTGLIMNFNVPVLKDGLKRIIF